MYSFAIMLLEMACCSDTYMKAQFAEAPKYATVEGQCRRFALRLPP